MILFDVALVFLSGILTLSVYYIDKLRDPNLLELGYFLNSNLPSIIRNEKSYVIFTNLLYDKLIYIPISIGISIIILGIVRSVLQHSITKRHRLYNVLNTIIGSDFFGNISDSRITVFKCYSYIRSLSLYVIYWFWDSRYRNKFEIFKKRFPKFNRRYLFFYKRKGVPNENHSSLKIMVPNNESEINGFIAHCLYINAYDSINLPSLKNININNYDDLDSIPRNKKKLIKEYMKKSYINDFEFLKSIYKHSQNLAVTPLTKKNGKIWGAVSIDNDSNTDLFSGKENLINSCMKIIQEVI